MGDIKEKANPRTTILETKIEEKLDVDLEEAEKDLFPEDLIAHLKATDKTLYDEIMESFELDMDSDGNFLLKEKDETKGWETSLNAFILKAEEGNLEVKRSRFKETVKTKFRGLDAEEITVTTNESGLMTAEIGGTSYPFKIEQTNEGKWKLSGIAYKYTKSSTALIDARILWKTVSKLDNGELRNTNTAEDIKYLENPFESSGGKLTWIIKGWDSNTTIDSYQIQCPNKKLIVDFANNQYKKKLIAQPQTVEKPEAAKKETEQIETDFINVFTNNADSISQEISDTLNDLADYEADDTKQYRQRFEDIQTRANEWALLSNTELLGLISEFKILTDELNNDIATENQLSANPTIEFPKEWTDLLNNVPDEDPIDESEKTKKSSKKRPAAVVSGVVPMVATGTNDFQSMIAAEVLPQLDGLANASEDYLGDGDSIDVVEGVGSGVISGPIKTSYHSVESGEGSSEVVTMKLETPDVLEHSRIHHFVGTNQDCPFQITETEKSTVHLMSTVGGEETKFTWKSDVDDGGESWCDKDGHRLRVLDGTVFTIYGRTHDVVADGTLETPETATEDVPAPVDSTMPTDAHEDAADTSTTTPAEVAPVELEGKDLSKTLSTLNKLHNFGTRADLPSINRLNKALLNSKPKEIGEAFAVQIGTLDVRNGVAHLQITYTDTNSRKSAIRHFTGVSNFEVKYERSIGEITTLDSSAPALRNSSENKSAVRDMFRNQIFNSDVNGSKKIPELVEKTRKERAKSLSTLVLAKAQKLNTLSAKAGAAGRDKRQDRLTDKADESYEELEVAMGVLEESKYFSGDTAIAAVQADIDKHKE